MKLNEIEISSVHLYGLRSELYAAAHRQLWIELLFSVQDQLWNPGTGILDQNIGDVIEDEIEKHEATIN